MNLPNKITVGRLVISILVLVLLLIPWYSLGVTWPTYLVGSIVVDLKYIVVGVLFAIGSFSDFLDGYLARKNNLVTDFGKVADAIADKVLVNGLLILLAYERSISIIIPVVIITRDIVVDSCKMLSGSKGKVVAASIMGKIKTICMMVGLTLVLFYNLPFELIGLPVADLLLIVATILSVISGCQYYFNCREFLFPKTSK
ncbi:MAG: CDP-diacylglycerol--glycerol-3-phosphate 3-phosphatidyltransferase [Bacilli bacterium]